jgi:hypothetical protein
MTLAENPGLLFGRADLPALRAKVRTEPFKSMVERLIADAERDDRATPGTTAAGDYGEATAAHRCGFLYTLTGDDAWARKARDYATKRLEDPTWADRGVKGLTLYYVGKSIALTYDWCRDAPSWDPSFQSEVARKLRLQADAIFESGGTEQNTNRASNWQALRFSAAGLCYLALGGNDTADRVRECYRRAADYLAQNLGESPLSRGWNIEGLGYTYYAMGNGICPFGIAVQRRYPDLDLRREVAASRYTLWTCFATLTKSAGGLIRPDFGDDNPGTDAEGTLGFAFYYCPPNLLPGLRYWYDRTVGTKGERTFDHGRFGTISSILYYPEKIAETEPLQIAEWRSLFQDSGGNGYFTWRNRYRDSNDLVAQVYVKLRGNRGHNGPDALSFRIVGRDTFWATGGGRYGPKLNGQDAYLRSMNTLYPSDPDGPLQISSESGRVVESTPLNRDGGGTLVSAIHRSNVGVRGHTRRFAADFSGRGGAPGVFIVCDTSVDGLFWQLCTLEQNRLQVTGERTFLITGPTGSTLQGTLLYAAGKPRIQTGTRIRGSTVGAYKNNHFVHFRSEDGCFLVVFTIAEKGKRHPDVFATGVWGSKPHGVVQVGRLHAFVDGDSLRIR